MKTHTDTSLRPHWNVQVRGEETVVELAREIKSLAEERLQAGVNPRQQKVYSKIINQDNLKVLASLLLNRGIQDAQGALDFLCPDKSWLHSWEKLPDIDIALERLEQARSRGEKVLIHGDYDADGITATALLVTAFREWGLDVCYYLPHRIDDGYGLSRAGLEQGQRDGCTLVVTVDCGVSNPQEVEYAKELGMDVIITDHHLPPDELPRALAVVNPKRKDSAYPFSELAGVGVAWKLATILVPQTSSATLQLAALGTVADLVPLLDENRVLVAKGLEEINSNPLPGIAALATAADCQLGKLDSTNIAFGLAPRLNATGRMDSATVAVDLLLETDPDMAAHLAQGLDQKNQYRRQVEMEILIEAMVQAEEEMRAQSRILVLHGKNWHPGVIGIVASRVLEKYYRPTIILSGEGMLTGSARSIAGFDIHAALKGVSHHLDKFGGHPGAAGLSVEEQTMETFRQALNEYAVDAGIDQLLQPVIELEAIVTPGDISLELVDEIALLEPFGFGNPQPVFAFEGFKAGSVDLVGKDKTHLRLRLDGPVQDNIWAIGFSQAPLVHNIDKGSFLQVAGMLSLNRWNGHTSVQVQFTDIRGQEPWEYLGRKIYDRRRCNQPWLSQLMADSSTVFFANTRWGAQRLLGTSLENCRVVTLPPDKYREKVYNLEANCFCFLDPAWTAEQLRDIISLLPQGCQIHLFGNSAAPEHILRPNLNLLRQFYKAWRDNGGAAWANLLDLLPQDLSEPILLERMLAILTEAGLAGESRGRWELSTVKEKVDLTRTQAWSRYSSQLKEYQNWLQGFCSQTLDQLLA